MYSDSLDYSAREVRKAEKAVGGAPFRDVMVLQRDYGYLQVRHAGDHHIMSCLGVFCT